MATIAITRPKKNGASSQRLLNMMDSKKASAFFIDTSTGKRIAVLMNGWQDYTKARE